MDRLRQEYAENELDHDRNPTEDGFVEWLVRQVHQARGAASAHRAYISAGGHADRIASRLSSAAEAFGRFLGPVETDVEKGLNSLHAGDPLPAVAALEDIARAFRLLNLSLGGTDPEGCVTSDD
jgi:hypothetical protein